MPTRILSAADIHTIVQYVGLHAIMDDMIARLTHALETYDPAACSVPPRAGFAYSEPYTGLVEWMPVMTHGQSATIKVVGYHPCNPVVNDLPTILSTTSAYDVTSGRLLGLVDSTFLTALRTGAATAVASRCLARPDSQVIGLIGAGAQAVTQLHALSRLFPIARVLVADVDPVASRSFARRTAFLDLPTEALGAARLPELVAAADILCTATSVAVGGGPVFADGAMRPWLHVNAVGSDFPGKTELPLTLLQRSVVCPDFLEQALHEGECQQLPPAAVGPSLVALVQQPAARAGLADRLTVFDSTGWALEDQVALEMIMAYAADLRIGHLVELDGAAVDPKDPYGFALAHVAR